MLTFTWTQISSDPTKINGSLSSCGVLHLIFPYASVISGKLRQKIKVIGVWYYLKTKEIDQKKRGLIFFFSSLASKVVCVMVLVINYFVYHFVFSIFFKKKMLNIVKLWQWWMAAEGNTLGSWFTVGSHDITN